MIRNRFLIFAGINYEEGGGWYDFVLETDSIKNAIKKIKRFGIGPNKEMKWAHIVNLEQMEIIKDINWKEGKIIIQDHLNE